MSVRGTPARSQDLQVKGVSLIAAVRFAKSAEDEIAKPSRLQTPKPQPKNGDTAFDPEGFLVRSGLGKKVLSLKKDQVAYSQGGPGRHNLLRATGSDESDCDLRERKRSNACLG